MPPIPPRSGGRGILREEPADRGAGLEGGRVSDAREQELEEVSREVRGYR
ncbi:hypothetical protein [Nocardiopsis sp. RV163]|nr:hypothetical protein [Nocardiopsis sp. RV163]